MDPESQVKIYSVSPMAYLEDGQTDHIYQHKCYGFFGRYVIIQQQQLIIKKFLETYKGMTPEQKAKLANGQIPFEGFQEIPIHETDKNITLGNTIHIHTNPDQHIPNNYGYTDYCIIELQLNDEQLTKLYQAYTDLAQETIKKARSQMSNYYNKNRYFTIERPETNPELTSTRLIFDGKISDRPDFENLSTHMIIFELEKEIGHTKLEKRLYIPAFYYYQIARIEQKHFKKSLTKAGLHLEKQKFGAVPDKLEQITIDDILEQNQDRKNEYLAQQPTDKKAELEQTPITTIGLDLNLADNRALHVVQTLLTNTDYKGNDKDKGEFITEKDNHPDEFIGYLPTMIVKISEFLELYGVSSFITERGKKEYSVEGRRQALEALTKLSSTLNLFIYTRTRFVDDKPGQPQKEIKEEVIAFRPLLQNLNFIRNPKTKQIEKIEFKPCFVLMDQIDSYFVMKNENQYKEIQQRFGKTDKKLNLFIDYLQVLKTERLAQKLSLNNIKITFHTLAHKLRFNALINQRKWKDIDLKLKDFFDKATELEYILPGYQIIPGYDRDQTKAIFSINPAKVYIPEHTKEQKQQEKKTKKKR